MKLRKVPGTKSKLSQVEASQAVPCNGNEAKVNYNIGSTIHCAGLEPLVCRNVHQMLGQVR